MRARFVRVDTLSVDIWIGTEVVAGVRSCADCCGLRELIDCIIWAEDEVDPGGWAWGSFRGRLTHRYRGCFVGQIRGFVDIRGGILGCRQSISHAKYN